MTSPGSAASPTCTTLYSRTPSRPARDHDRPGDRQISPVASVAVRLVESLLITGPRLVAERDLVADRLAEHPQQPLAAVLGLVVASCPPAAPPRAGCAARRAAARSGSFERVEVRGVHRDDAVLGVEELLECACGLRGRRDLDARRRRRAGSRPPAPESSGRSAGSCARLRPEQLAPDDRPRRCRGRSPRPGAADSAPRSASRP